MKRRYQQHHPTIYTAGKYGWWYCSCGACGKGVGAAGASAGWAEHVAEVEDMA